ncbi:levansucrase [Roseibacterium sp. SDUM158017]|uniref:levansucrase n=1 Tax=Roseicyclus salinarum TaxID=3036773 RepID=UPI0024151BAC|nr:levansucrase [Roseibacterium sp. SDUM158017]MDG4648154.1 levansucrase [Roseibacterium sp. SDUM158017]
MGIASETHWIWDSWYARDGDTWHAFFLQAPKSLGDPELRHHNARVGHAVSRDLVSWEHLGECFAPSAGPAFDDMAIWTGSVVRDDSGPWHLFYTGICRAEDGLVQRIGHATSEDLHNWTRVSSDPVLDIEGPAAHAYEADLGQALWSHRAFRDPWVMRDPEGEGWLMYLTARASGIDEPNAGGAIARATSPDLERWTLREPVFTGGFGQLEVPQVFRAGGRWCMLFCTAAHDYARDTAEASPGGPVTGTHYLVADDPRGPWRLAPLPFLDGAQPCARYASRVLETEEGLRLMGFADRPEGVFVGEIMDPAPLEADADGRLLLV